MDAINVKSGSQPAAADSPESCAMATGPMSCRGDVVPTNNPPSVLKIKPPNSMFFATLSLSASHGPGLNDFICSPKKMPIMPPIATLAPASR
mgnify:CR=1 FL=1